MAANYAIGYMPGSITVTQASTTTTINSVSPSPATVGQPVTVTVTVFAASAPGYGTPTGTVTVNSSPESQTCQFTLGSATSCTLTFTTAQVDQITASYGGDTNFTASTTSAATPLTVNGAAAPLAITAGPATGFQGYTYPATLLGATGGTPPYTWSGASIAGMNLTTGGVLTGYPTAAGTANVTVTDSNSVSVSLPFTINSSTVVRGGGVDIQTISNVTLNSGPIQLTTTPGATVAVNLTYNIVQGAYVDGNPVGCPGCIDQLVVGFVNTTPTTCVYDGQPGPPGTGDQPGSVSLTAPSTPGRYYIVFSLTENYYCQPAPGSLYNGVPAGSAYTLASTDPAIAVVDVIPTSSVTVGDVTATNISVTPQVFTSGTVTATFTWSQPSSGTIGLGFNTDPTIDECGGQVTSPLTAPSLPGRYYLSLANPNTCASPPVPWPSGIPGANFASFIGAVDVLPQPAP